MRKSKSLLAIILALSVFLLSGCANIQSLLSSNNSDFYEIKAISDKAEIYASIDIRGDNILLLTADGIEDYKLTLYDAQNNKITAETSLSDCPLEYISGAKFTGENEIIVFDDGSEAAIAYDFSLNQTGTADYDFVDSYDSAPESGFLNDTFAYYDTYAYSYEGDSYYIVFYDDLENVYVFDGEDESIYCADGKKLFTVESKYSESDDCWNATVYVKDLENGLCINSMGLESVSKGLFNDVMVSAISDKYVCFADRISNDQTGGSKSTLYLWKYTESPKNEKLEVKSMTESGILEENDKIVSELNGKYGINVYVNEKPQFGYEVDLDAAPLQVNHVLTQLSTALALFPENFVKEIYKDAEYVKGLNIHIVENIDGANAFANDFSEYYEICFGCRGFSRSVVFHEFMHLIDNRIQTYYDDNNMDFYGEWWALNPEGFDYYYDDDHDSNEEYFISYYAMTNVAEDLADTFQAMYEAYENDGDYRFEDYEHVNKKAALICEAIRKAFPSMANAENVCWEKYAEFIN